MRAPVGAPEMCAARQPRHARHLVDAPFRQHAGKILALMGAAALGATQRRLRDRARHSSMLRRSNQSRRCISNARADRRTGARRARVRALRCRASARSSFAPVRNGPTSSAMAACSSTIIAAELGRRGRLAAAHQRDRARRGSPAERSFALARAARAAALRPARRPNTSASVTALPESRLAPLAPPTASPAAKRPGTLGLHARSTATPPM